MQHIELTWQRIIKTGILDVPFSIHSEFSLVDLNDLAEATAVIATETKHDFASYQLAGPRALSHIEIAKILSKITGKSIQAQKKPLSIFNKEVMDMGMPKARIVSMIKMNNHYDKHGLIGNSNNLEWILQRPPTTFEQFVERNLTRGA